MGFKNAIVRESLKKLIIYFAHRVNKVFQWLKVAFCFYLHGGRRGDSDIFWPRKSPNTSTVERIKPRSGNCRPLLGE